MESYIELRRARWLEKIANMQCRPIQDGVSVQSGGLHIRSIIISILFSISWTEKSNIRQDWCPKL